MTFRSHLDGSLHRFTPELAIGVQEALGADIAVAFDQPVTPSSPRAVVADATERTHRWAERSLAAHNRPDQALFGIVQGGLEPDLRAESTRFIARLPFDGICIGGLAGDETPEQRDAALDIAVPAPRRRSAAALPHGPRVAGGPPRGGSPREWTCSIPSCPPASPGTASCGCRVAGSTSGTRDSSTIRRRSRRTARASSAGDSRGPTSPICSGRRSCSPTASRLVTT